MPIVRKYNGIDLSAPSTGVTNNYTTTNITGTTAETILSTVLIPANTFKVYDIIDIESRIRKTNANGTVTIRIRIGTTQSLSATNFGFFTSTSAAHTYVPIWRRLVIKNLTTGTEVIDSATSSVHDLSVALVHSNITIDWSVDNYIIVTGQLASASDVMNCMFVVIKNLDGSL